MVALARVVFTSREHVIALEPRGKGLLGVTLRYPYEVRKEDEYFADIEDEKIPKDMMELASHIVETKSGHFKPEEFEDHYEDALKELLRREDRIAKSARTSQSHQPYGCASPKRGRRTWRWARAKRTASSAASHSEESRPVICAAEEGRLILAPILEFGKGRSAPQRYSIATFDPRRSLATRELNRVAFKTNCRSDVTRPGAANGELAWG
jgi:hypothetical protein